MAFIEEIPKSPLQQAVDMALPTEASPTPELSENELLELYNIADGVPVAESATELGKGKSTISKIRTGLDRKFQADTRPQTLFKAVVHEVVLVRPVPRGVFVLEDREEIVLGRLAQGESSRQIGSVLGVSATIVDQKIYQLYSRLGVNNRERMIYAACQRLLFPLQLSYMQNEVDKL